MRIPLTGPPTTMRSTLTRLREPETIEDDMDRSTRTRERLDDWLERDLDAEARSEHAPVVTGLDRQIRQVARLLERGRCPIVVGPTGVGKTAALRELVRRHHLVEAVPALVGRRVLQLSIRRRLGALAKREGFSECFHRLIELLCGDELGDATVVLDDLHLLEPFDLEDSFEHLILRCPGRVVGEGLAGPIATMLDFQPALHELCSVVPVEEPSPGRCAELLRRRDPAARRYRDEAIETAIDLGDRFLGRQHLPAKAIALLGEAADAADDLPVDAAVVREAFCRREQVPLDLVEPARAAPLAETRDRIRRELVGQEAALDAVLRTVALVRAGLSDPRRPFGVFLFTGPTGVGKTHLAQLLAAHLFGDRERLLRLNMADFPAASDAGTLFGEPDRYQLAQQRGLLSLRLSGLSFGVLLLDEFEKAHPAVHDGFLPVFDEGRFLNGAGEAVGLRSLVIIATSNAGAEAHDGRRVGFDTAADPERTAACALHDRFRPELLNRFDEIVHFRPLGRVEIRAIARRELAALAGRAGLARRRLRLAVDDDVLEHLIDAGHDPAWGARFLRRTLEREVATALAERILAGAPGPGDTLRLCLADGRVVARMEPVSTADTNAKLFAAEPAPAAAAGSAGQR